MQVVFKDHELYGWLGEVTAIHSWGVALGETRMIAERLGTGALIGKRMGGSFNLTWDKVEPTGGYSQLDEKGDIIPKGPQDDPPKHHP